MDILLNISAMLAAVHGYLYARWLMKKDMKSGGFFVYLLVVVCISFPLYKMVRALF